MFAKMPRKENFQHHQTPPPPQPPLHPHHYHHFQLTQRESQASEDSGSQSPGGTTAPAAPPTSDGATIEVVRRPRGRPPGSKNKPKPPVIITRLSEPAMSPYVLEIAGGADLIEAINRFSRNRNSGICVLSATGTVANVTLRQPSTTPGAPVIFHGRFEVLSLSATILPATTSAMMKPVSDEFAISLAGPQGQVVGGTVVGPLFAAGTVYVIAASFNNPSFHRLPMEEDVRSSGNEGHSPPPESVHGGGGDGGHLPPSTAESCGMSFYSGHLNSDVIWAPTARQPPPHY